MNILLSSVGRRSYLVNYFKDLLKLEGGKVIGVNSEPMTAGMYACDKSYIVPKITNKNYISTLLDIAIKEKVSAIIPLFDIDLPYLAKAKKIFNKHSIIIIVSSEYVINIANDKWKTYLFLKENNIKTPLTFINLKKSINSLKNKIINYPLYIKPRFGMGSIGVFKVDNKEELLFFYNYVEKQIINSYLKELSIKDPNNMVLIQESIIGQEFGIDILNDLNSNYIMSVIKEKISMRSGETDISIVIENKELSELSITISKKLAHIGNLDVDILFDGIDYYILELNSRFGGGFPFSYLAGANFPKMLIQMIKQDKVVIPKIAFGTKSLKSIHPIVIN